MRLLILFVFIVLLGATVHAANIISSTTWFGNGGYKIARENIWPLGSCSTCTIGPNWDGTTVMLSGFKNEMVGGMLWMQAGASNATKVSVALSPLTGPGGSVISSTPTLCAGVTNYNTRDFELFVATYVQIQGMTELSWANPPYEERDLPNRFRAPCTTNGNNDCIANIPSLWVNRPDHDKFYPDALIPQECLTSSFTVAASSSQGVWLDVYLSTSINSGFYTGTLTITENVTVSTSIPIQINVYNGSLPTRPSFNYIADVSEDDINYRLNGITHGSGCATAACIATDNAFYQTLWRHRIIPVGDAPDTNTNEYPSLRYQGIISGSLFTSANGYRGPGTSTGVPVYSIGTYASWSNNPNWSQVDSSLFCTAVSSWGAYFKNNYPTVRSFVYLADEPADLTNTNKWSTWISTKPTCQTAGYTVHSWVTNNWTSVNASAPYVDNPATTQSIASGYTHTDWQNAANKYLTVGSTQGWYYNGHPSWDGTENATEDDGMSNWEPVWAYYLKGVSGAFQWETTQWYNPGNKSPAESPLWTSAQTFGFDIYPSTDASRGRYGFNFANGDGVLLYPGTEVSTYTASSYGFLGAIVSMRLKNLRRGMNDYDYLTQAYAINPSSTTAILSTLVPSVLWDITCFTNVDCTYAYGGRIWNEDPNYWELQRQNLAAIITPGPTETLSGNGSFSGNGSIQ